MPRNPMLSSGRDAQNTGINQPSKAAEPHKSYIQHENEFNLSHSQLATLRYADIHPFFCIDGLPADRMPFKSVHELRSYTLQAPMLSDVKMHKSFTMVPMEAILPNTWDRFIVNPTKGDDIPEDAYCTLSSIPLLPFSFTSAIPSIVAPTHGAAEIYAMIIAECFASRGSLCASLGIDFSSLYPCFDDLFDSAFIPYLKVAPYSFEVRVGNIVHTVALNESVASAVSGSLISVRDLLDFLRDGSIEQINFLPTELYANTNYNNEFSLFKSSVTNFIGSLEYSVLESYEGYLIDFSRVYAYQLSCVAIQTDDSIDDIYTPSLFRDLIYEYADPQFFDYNGSPVQYDAFSHKVVMSALQEENIMYIYRFVTLLFSFRKSLKYGDYFIDARPQPYAVGDMSAEVKDGSVSAIDSTRSILAQRFLNWSNRVGNKLHDYILSMTGVTPTAKTTEPKYIIHETMPVSGFEVENTGSEQRDNVSVTTQLKAGDSRYMFDISINDYCIILGLAHFDVKRNYIGGIDRNALKTNRFDYFNKFFQYAGDQDIKRIELNAALPNPEDAMAYTTRHMQYKTAISRAVGGFGSSALQSWAYVNDESQSNVHGIGVFGINSDFIRNWNSEFDRFYGPLTGYSLGNYFHFICKFDNILEMKRQMAIAPDIL